MVWLLLAASSELPWVDPIINIATVGGFGAMLWYMLLRYIPGIEERHRNERAEWQATLERREAEWQAALTKRDADYIAVLDRVRESVQDLRDGLRTNHNGGAG